MKGGGGRAALGATAVFAVGAGEEEGHVLAVSVEGEEAEVVGVEGVGGGAGGAVDGAVLGGGGRDGGVEAVEQVDGGFADAAEGLGDEGDDLVALGYAVGVVAGVRGDVAVAGGVVEGALVGAAALLGAEDGPEQGLLDVTEGEVVALGAGWGAAVVLRAVAGVDLGVEGCEDLDFEEDVGAPYPVLKDPYTLIIVFKVMGDVAIGLSIQKKKLN